MGTPGRHAVSGACLLTLTKEAARGKINEWDGGNDELILTDESGDQESVRTDMA